MKSSFVLALAAYEWERIEPHGLLPKARQGHVSVPHGDGVYIIGGCVSDFECFSDVHRFDINTLTWNPVGLQGEPMEPRGGHSMAVVGPHVYVMFGASSDASFDDVFRLDFADQRWLRGQTVRSSSAPVARTNQASCAGTRGRIYTFGGYDVNRGEYLNDIWIMDTFWEGDWKDMDTFPVTWTKVDARGNQPSGRESHAAAFVEDRVYIVGGYSEGAVVSDVYIFDTENDSWSLVDPIAPFPRPRQGHVMQRHGRALVVAGGCAVSQNQEVCFNDAWSFDVPTSRWTQESADPRSWKPREGASGAFVGTRLFLFGGQHDTQSYGDIIALDTKVLNCVHGRPLSQGCTCDEGYGGNDCMDRLDCPFDCHGNGQCRPFGCDCASGFFGDSCAREVHCPHRCSAHGLCLSDASCQCFPGYSGQDCSLGFARCPEDCNGHGECQPDATCSCALGYVGTSCAIEQHCPLDCCAPNGTCGVKECRCNAGWFGSACNLNWGTYQMLSTLAKHATEEFFAQAQDKSAQADKAKDVKELMRKNGIASSEMASVDSEIESLTAEARRLKEKAEKTSITSLGVNIDICQPVAMSSPISLVRNATDVVVSKQIHALHQVTRKTKIAPPETDDFGIERLNKKGVVGTIPSECKDNCNSQGFCFESVCYCKPGYYGTTCATKKQSRKGTAALATVCIGLLAAMSISFIAMFIFLQHTARQKRAMEREMGYVV